MQIKNYVLHTLFLFIFIGFFSSCVNQKEFIYFQEPVETPAAKVNTVNKYSTTLHQDDLIAIQVSAMDPDVVRPFNNNAIGKETGSSNMPNTYLIDNEGMIDFPILGKLKLGGLTTTDATSLLKEKLKVYVNNPIVNLRITNFKVTVLGDVKNPGVYTIPNERITLPEALGLAGDLNITGVRKNILVIREVDGKKTETRVDLTSKAVFTSPVYYLRQNDLIYVEPNKSKINSTDRSTLYGTLAITGVSLLINIINLLTR